MTSLRQWAIVLVCMALLGVALAGCASAPTNSPSSGILEKITAAKTRSDHEAIAAYYDQEAANAHAKVDEHRKMAQSYQDNGPTKGPNMAAHCNAIANNVDAVAKAFESMAASHRAMAEQMKP